MEIVDELVLGIEVWHKKWHAGRVVDICNDRVTVCFEEGDKKFEYPTAFKGFLEIVDQELYKRKFWEYRSRRVVSEIESRKIKHFVHFTNVKNLKSILEYGLLPVRELEEKGICYIKNDKDRYDKKLEANSLSITFPNYKMFYRCRTNNPEETWVVLRFDAEKVAKLDCAYFEHNAASSEYSRSNWDDFTSYGSFEKLFGGVRDGLKDCDATDPQSEVMVSGCIPANYICDICFEKIDALKQMQIMFPDCSMFINRSFFQPRNDYKRWSKNNGEKIGVFTEG